MNPHGAAKDRARIQQDPTIPVPFDQDCRRRITENLDTSMLVEAAAGTGKTTCMVGRMVALIREGQCTLDSMAAVTFTRKAAAELADRFRLELQSAVMQTKGPAGRRLTKAVDSVEHCFIGTIHAFCARLLRQRPVEAAVDLAFHEIDSEEDLRLREECWDAYVALLCSREDRELNELRKLGLEIGQLRASFLRFANYPDVDQWPAPGVELDGVVAIQCVLREYLEHIQKLIPTFPVYRGNDDLMYAYEQIDRQARHRDLNCTAELMQVLERFVRMPKVVLKCWPHGTEQGRLERDRWKHFKSQAEPVLLQWQARRYKVVIHILSGAL